MNSLKLLSKISLSFQKFNNFNQEMNDILTDIGNSIDVSRIYIFINESEDIINNVFEWCSSDNKPQIDNLQKISYHDIPSWKKLLYEDNFICSSDINNLPQDIIDGLKPQKIKSLIVYPLIIKNNINGFIGFDECRYHRTWQNRELELLETISGIIANAYERKIFQEELVDSKNNFQNFFETMEDMLIILSANKEIVYCNQSLIDKLGYSLSELQEMNILDLHPLDQRNQASEIINAMLKSETNHCPLEVQGKCGQIYSVETRIVLGKWNNQDCIFSISKDISEEKESIRLFSNVFENNPLPMAINSVKEGNFTKFNEAFLKKTGYTKAELLGKTTWDLEIFVEPDKAKKLCSKVMQGEIIKDQEILLKCKDERVLNVLISIEKICSMGEQSFLTAIIDLTEKAILTRNLADQCQKLTNIIEGTNLGTWEWDMQTGEMLINEQWAKILGYSLAELEPISIKTWNNLVHPEDLIVSNKLLTEHANGKREYYSYEARMKHKNGHWIWIQDAGKVTQRDNEGNPIKMFGTHSDISSKKQALEALSENEKRFFLALDETKAGLWDFDIINHKLFLSPMWKNLLGYQDDEIENSIEAWQELWHPDEKNKLIKLASNYLNGNSGNYEVINRMRHKDGSYRWILTRGGILRDELGNPIRWIGTNIDITKEQKQALELERFFSINLDLLCITDMKGNFIKLNMAWEDVLGYSITELKKRNFLDFIHPEDLPNTIKAMKQLKKGNQVIHFVNRYRNINGDYRHIEWRSNPHEELIYAAARDITERILYEKNLLEVSNRDSLTNVYNRRCIYSRAEEIIEEYKRTGKIFSICILDIDNFKKINDNYGHQIGDYILKQFTEIIDENLRPYDLLGRYGGEEFILILNHTNKNDSFLIIERILNIIREKVFNCNGESIRFSFSAGISNCREIKKEDLSIYDLVEMADKRMYQAKKEGKNRIVYDDLKNSEEMNF